jgi:3-hydroxybutyryl-CoA dehydrogenase
MGSLEVGGAPAEQLEVGILGAGTMGAGIAITVARAGHRVWLRDLDEARAERGLQTIRAFLEQSVERGKLSAAERDAALRNTSTTTRVEDLGGCEIVIEAILEDLELKARTFGELDEICGPDTLFHTNTSTLSVTRIAAGSRRPERVVGTHYCNPAPLMKLVEVVRGQRTSSEAIARTAEFVASLGKTAVHCGDTPGFLVNLFLVPFENDCIRALEAGMGSVESIDKAIRFGLGYPMGTFQLLDIVGLDIHRAVASSLYEQLKDPRFAAPPLVDRMIAAGQLGRKVGEGFYAYERAAGSFGA